MLQAVNYAPMVLAGLVHQSEHGAVRVIRGYVEVYAPELSNDEFSGCISVLGHLVEQYDEEEDRWELVCPASDAHFMLPAGFCTAAVLRAAAIDDAAIARLKQPT